jgi:hypothetical protein
MVLALNLFLMQWQIIAHLFFLPGSSAKWIMLLAREIPLSFKEGRRRQSAFQVFGTFWVLSRGSRNSASLHRRPFSIF